MASKASHRPMDGLNLFQLNKGTQMKPLSNKLLVELVKKEKETTTPSGIVLTGTDNAEADEGIVIETGPGYAVPAGVLPMQVQKGDHILFKKENAFQFSFKGTKYLLVREDEVVAVL